MGTELSAVDGVLHATMAAGFRFIHPRDETGEVVEIVGQRFAVEIVDAFRIRDVDDVTAARWRIDEYGDPRARPLWAEAGEVLDVLPALLDLPCTGAAARPRSLPSDFWLPDQSWHAR